MEGERKESRLELTDIAYLRYTGHAEGESLPTSPSPYDDDLPVSPTADDHDDTPVDPMFPPISFSPTPDDVGERCRLMRRGRVAETFFFV